MAAVKSDTKTHTAAMAMINDGTTLTAETLTGGTTGKQHGNHGAKVGPQVTAAITATGQLRSPKLGGSYIIAANGTVTDTLAAP
ncbi:MAG: hypothetical protein L7F78_14430 [Syntrophales bacterium LBB04]|nr:hypothetical protein [Syntrophales bacterium LBB04]